MYNIFDGESSKLNFEPIYSDEYNSLFDTAVVSDGFTGRTEFSISRDEIKQLMLQLKFLEKKQEGNCKITDNESDSYILLEFNRGELYIYGQMGGSYHENFIKFAFRADQTVIGLLIEILRN